MSFLRNMFQWGASGATNVDVRAVAERSPKRVIDVREPSEFTGELGHIEGAELVPLATLPEAARAWPRDTELVVVCRSGARSSRAAQVLKELGFERVVNMSGGMTAWNQAGLPVERSAPRGR